MGAAAPLGCCRQRPGALRGPLAERLGPPGGPPPRELAAPGLASRPPSAKQLRDAENQRALGGLRAPWRALERLPGLARVGRLVRAALAQSEAGREVQRLIIAKFGAKDFAGPDAQLLTAWREDLRRSLSAPAEAQRTPRWGQPSPVQAELLQKLLQEAGDPENALREWVVEGVPLGVERAIPTAGVFPPLAPPARWRSGGWARGGPLVRL